MGGERFESCNANPVRAGSGDSIIRAIARVTEQCWEKTYMELCMMGMILGSMPDEDNVWGAYLRKKGFRRAMLADDPEKTVTVKSFCAENPRGRYVLVLPRGAVAVVEGKYMDTWDCGDEIPIYYWVKGE